MHGFTHAHCTCSRRTWYVCREVLDDVCAVESGAHQQQLQVGPRSSKRPHRSKQEVHLRSSEQAVRAPRMNWKHSGYAMEQCMRALQASSIHVFTSCMTLLS
jgi:hypothetical protein